MFRNTRSTLRTKTMGLEGTEPFGYRPGFGPREDERRPRRERERKRGQERLNAVAEARPRHAHAHDAVRLAARELCELRLVDVRVRVERRAERRFWGVCGRRRERAEGQARLSRWPHLRSSGVSSALTRNVVCVSRRRSCPGERVCQQSPLLDSTNAASPVFYPLRRARALGPPSRGAAGARTAPRTGVRRRFGGRGAASGAIAPRTGVVLRRGFGRGAAGAVAPRTGVLRRRFVGRRPRGLDRGARDVLERRGRAVRARRGLVGPRRRLRGRTDALGGGRTDALGGGRRLRGGRARRGADALGPRLGGGGRRRRRRRVRLRERGGGGRAAAQAAADDGGRATERVV